MSIPQPFIMQISNFLSRFLCSRDFGGVRASHVFQLVLYSRMHCPGDTGARWISGLPRQGFHARVPLLVHHLTCSCVCARLGNQFSRRCTHLPSLQSPTIAQTVLLGGNWHPHYPVHVNASLESGPGTLCSSWMDSAREDLVKKWLAEGGRAPRGMGTGTWK
jgi:hypothetical protein